MINPLKEFRNGYRKSSTIMWAMTKVRKNDLELFCMDSTNSPYYCGYRMRSLAGNVGMYAGLIGRAIWHFPTMSKNAEYIFDDRRSSD